MYIKKEITRDDYYNRIRELIDENRDVLAEEDIVCIWESMEPDECFTPHEPWFRDSLRRLEYDLEGHREQYASMN